MNPNDTDRPPQALSDRFSAATLTRLLKDSAYALTAFPLAWVGCVVAVTGVVLGLSLAVLVVGIPILVATVYVCRWFVQVERLRIRKVGRTTSVTRYPDAIGGESWWGRQLSVLRDPQSWLDVAWVLLLAPITGTFAFCVVLTWWATIFGGASYAWWQQWLPEPNGNTLASLLGLGEGRVGESLLNAGFAVLALLTVVPVTRWVVDLHIGAGRLLLDSRRNLREALQTERGQRSAAQQAEVEALRRLERDIHDGPQQRLVRLGIDLGRARRLIGTEPDKARSILDEALVQTQETVGELRTLSRGIAPPLLVDRGLSVALAELAARHPGSVIVETDVPAMSPAVETAVYFTVSEALTNVAKHAAADQVRVAVARLAGERGDELTVVVIDDGVGGAHPGKGQGLTGLQQRLAGVGGTLSVDSPVGGPTVLTARIPWASCVS